MGEALARTFEANDPAVYNTQSSLTEILRRQQSSVWRWLEALRRLR